MTNPLKTKELQPVDQTPEIASPHLAIRHWSPQQPYLATVPGLFLAPIIG